MIPGRPAFKQSYMKGAVSLRGSSFKVRERGAKKEKQTKNTRDYNSPEHLQYNVVDE